MGSTVCVCANTLYYPEGGGHFWVYLNWVLGLRALGCQVVWLEVVNPGVPGAAQQASVMALANRLERYGLAHRLALCAPAGEPLHGFDPGDWLSLDAAAESDLLLNMAYDIHPNIVGRFRRSALLDIDPGLLQLWLSHGHLCVAPHDVYFTIGETVGQPGARFPAAGLTWLYTPPCVALEWWPPCPTDPHAPFTTVSHWYGERQWVIDGDGGYANDKRDGFLPFLDLPRQATEPLELALCLTDEDEAEARLLRDKGWRVRDARTVASTPWDYQRYLQNSRGEFSCVKPSCVILENAWISDRTICYLACGKPAVVQYTGKSRFLPDAAGLLRFRSVQEASHCLTTAAASYEDHGKWARALAEEFFDARKVVGRVLERALA
jgi:hypothetical protein